MISEGWKPEVLNGVVGEIQESENRNLTLNCGIRRDQSSGKMNLTRYDGRGVPENKRLPYNVLKSRRYYHTRLGGLFRGEYIGIYIYIYMRTKTVRPLGSVMFIGF